MTVLVTVSVMTALLGVFLLVGGLTTAPDGRDASDPRQAGLLAARLGGRWAGLSRQRRWLIVGLVVAGVASYLITGWVCLVLMVPCVGLGFATLLVVPKNHDLELLEALDRWLHTMTATVATSKSIAEAIRASVTQAPVPLAVPLSELVRRLNDRWSLREALRAMADELATPDADAVLAALMVAAQRGGLGSLAIMRALSANVQQRLKAWREIESERAKPRIVVRQVTIISVVVLGAALLMGRSYFSAFGSPIGQVTLLVLGLSYVGALLALRRLAAPRRRDRILQGHPLASANDVQASERPVERLHAVAARGVEAGPTFATVVIDHA